jgi:anti-sigma factor RsiW
MTDEHAGNLDCERTRQTWHDRVDGLADPQDLASMQAHLAGCPECRRYVRQMDLLCGTLADLHAASERELPQPRRRPRHRVWTQARAAAMAAALLLVVGVGLYFSPWRQAGDCVTAASRHPGPPASQDLPRAESASETRTVRSVVQLRGESARAWMIEQCDSGHPRVHIYKLYPTLPLQSEANQSSVERNTAG